jgi:histidinol-phosphate aminotransferase
MIERRYGGKARLVNASGTRQSAFPMAPPKPKPWIEAISPYQPGRSDGRDGARLIKLSSNENPLGTSEAAQTALAAQNTKLSRYPDAGATKLRQAIGTLHGLDPDRIVCGTGSDELLHVAAGAYAGVGDEILYVRHGFSVYPAAAMRVGATPVEADDRDYATDIEALIAALTPRTRVVFLANPNNPTGTFVDRQAIGQIHDAMPPDCLLVVDQAYAEYLDPAEDDGGLELARNSSNVLITRTFSKIYGLAGERIGWGYAAPEIIATLNRIRGPFNVTTAGQHAAIAALGDQDFLAMSRTHNARWRGWLEQRIAAMGGLRAIPSKANFILILFEGALTAEQAHEGLLARGYATRWLPGQGLAHALRITVGTEAETRGLAAALEALLSGQL